MKNFHTLIYQRVDHFITLYKKENHSLYCPTTYKCIMDNQSDDESEPAMDNNDCNCLIEIVLKKRFASLPFNEKEIIVRSQKPTPILNIQSKTKTFQRYFSREIYEKVAWICGCAHLSKLFCWPCVLFSQEVNVWNKYGFSDLNNLSKARKRHECSQSHICSIVKFKKFTKESHAVDIQSAQIKANIETHNKEVAANRYVLSKLISTICFLAKQEQPSHFEHRENRGNCVDLLHLLSESDVVLKTHLDNSAIINSQSDRIQDDLISAISRVLLYEIKSEIRASKFVSIILNMTDINCEAQLSTIFRYLDENNEAQERFVGFIDVNPDGTIELFHHLHKAVEEFECSDKIIAQTYDGEVIMTGKHDEIQKEICDICPNSLFVHCYAHGLNQVLMQSVKHINGCKRFFNHISSFSSFFCKSSRRISLLDSEIKKQFPNADSTHWNNTSRILNMIWEYQRELIATFDRIINDEDERDPDAIIYAEALRCYLNDFDFNYYLHLFSTIFNSANVLFDILQNKTFDVTNCSNEIKKFAKFLDSKNDDFDSLWNKLTTDKLHRKRKAAECADDIKIKYQLLHSEILESLSINITRRFKDIECFKFMELFNVDKFKEYEKNFPSFLLKSLQLSYGKYFDFMKLRSELSYIYSAPDFHLKSINSIKELMLKDDIKDVLAEAFTLIQLIFTIPSTSISTDQSFSTIERIKTFIGSGPNEVRRQSALALISIENRLISNLKNNDKFYEDVINEFCKNEQQIKLNFKR